MHEEYELALPVLQSGDTGELDNLAKTLTAFPDGEDDFVGDRWIMLAIETGSVACVSWMLARRVDLTFRNDCGYTPLHAALEREAHRTEILEMLLAAGAPVNAKGINDWTPAHMAAARDDIDSLRVLIRYGADLSIRTNIDDYATPLEEARILGRNKAVQFLETLSGAIKNAAPN